MKGEPGGSLDRLRGRKLSVRTALAALLLSNAVPATAQTQKAPMEQTGVQTESAEDAAIRAEVLKLIQDRENFSRSTIYVLGSNHPSVKKEVQMLEDTKKAINDPQFIEGLKKIKSYGGGLVSMIGSVDPVRIKDLKRLDEVLSRIPAELRRDIVIVSTDLETDPGYNYDRAGLQEVAKKFASIYFHFTVAELHEMLNIDANTPNFSQSLADAAAKSSGKLNARLLLWRVKEKQVLPNAFQNKSFVDGLILLSQNEIELYRLTPIAATAETQRLLESRIGDSTFVSMLIAAQKLGFSPDYKIVQLPPEIYRNPNFAKNAEALKKFGISQFDLGSYSSLLSKDGLEEILQLPNAKATTFLLYQLEKIASDTEAWNGMREFARKYKGNAQMIEFIFELDKVRIKDQEFLQVFARYIEQGNRGNDSLHSAIFGAELAFIEQKTGKKFFDVIQSLPDYLEIVEDPKTNPVILNRLADFRGRALTGPILQMNELHDDPSENRLRQLKNYNAKLVFEIMIAGGSDAYLSTFRLAYNGNGYKGPEKSYSFKDRVVAEYGSMPAFFRAVKPDHKAFGTFLELLSQNNIMDTFLADLGSPEVQNAILREFLFDASAGMNDSQALTVSDLLRTTKSDSIRNFVFAELRNVQEKQGQSKTIDAKFAGLIIADYFQDQKSVPDWAQMSVDLYKEYFPDLSKYGGELAFKKEGDWFVNRQQHIFYDDREGKPPSAWDGHNSFRNFITGLGGSVLWDSKGVITKVTIGRGIEMEDKGDFILITKRNNKTKRMIRIYVNKPDRPAEEISRGYVAQATSEPPQIVMHRGHSFHAPKTIKLIGKSVTFTNLGSCGGAKSIGDVLDRALEPQVTATRGVGTMIVNDIVQRAIDNTLLEDGFIEWKKLRKQLDAVFARIGGEPNERWQSYQLPDQNRIALFIFAIKRIKTEHVANTQGAR